MSNIVEMPIDKRDPDVSALADRLDEALQACPENMPLVTIIGVLEVFKRSLIDSAYETLNDC
ncbi:MAG: hypothetical protein KGJ90_05140 [Patescibacteria group bacterium]|nr:hypothetical protein [Patescibacteria group bacterium]